MATQVQKNKMDLTWVHFAIVCVLMFGVGFIPPFGTVTVIGMKMIGVFLGLLYGWSTCGMFWPSLIGMIALGFTGVGTVKEIVVQGFGNETIVFVIFILVLVQMLIDSGAVSGISNFIITRKFLQGHPWRFSFVFLCVCGLLSTFGQAFAAFFLCWGILYDIFKKVDYKPYEAYPTIMLVGVVVSASAFSIMVPFKAMPLVILSTFASITGITVNYLQYMVVMIPSGLVMLAGYLLACKLVFKPDVERIRDVDVEKLATGDAGVNKHQKAVLIAFGIALLLLLLPGSLPKTWAVIGVMNQIGNAGLMIICTILFSLIKIEGKPILDFGAAAKGGVNWPIIFLLVTILLMSSLMVSDATGIKPFLVQILNPLFAGHSGMIFLILLFLVALLLTNFMNNIVVGIMFLPVLAAYYAIVGANPVVGVMMLLVAVNTAYLTPAAAPSTAMLFANTAWIKSKDMFKLAILIIIVFSIVSLTLLMGLGHLVF